MINVVINNSGYLWYLLAVPILIISHFIFLRSAKFKAMTFSNFDTIKRITGKSSGKIMTNNISLLILRLVILVSIIFAISSITLWYEAETSDRDFVIAIDSSASMLAKDFDPNRLEFAKEKAIDFVNSLDDKTNVGIVSFSGNSFIDSVLSDDKDNLISTLKTLEVMSFGGTDIPGAIICSTNLLMNSNRSRLLILISDGSNTVDVYNQKALSTALNYANNNHVIIHAIGIGSDSAPIGYLPEYYNLTAVYDAEQLKFIANQTRGNFYEGKNESQFSEVFDNIYSDIQEGYVQKDLTLLFLLISLLGLFLEWILINTRFRRLP